jgi:hypothetical protein
VSIKLQPGHIKCNVDAAFFNNNATTAYNFCFRNSIATLLLGESEYLHALKMAISNYLLNVTFETDIKTLVDTLLARNIPRNEFGDLVFECKSLLCSNIDHVVSFIIRQANMVAYSIIRIASSHPSLHTFHKVSATLYPLNINEMQ